MDSVFQKFYSLVALCLMLCMCRKKNQDDALNQICTYVPTYIDTTVNLRDMNNMQLKTKGYVYLRSGGRGIILHKVSDSEYRAFDRASSYKMAEVGCPLKVDSSAFFLKDTCSGSKFDFNGSVIQEPAICPLLEYSTSFVSSELLRIYHTQ